MDNKKTATTTPAKFRAGLYQHYKGGEYHVIDLAQHSETEEQLVVYRPLYGEQKLWVRPFEMFFEQVTVDNQLVDRFKWIKSVD
ncbi:MAG: DUF1653 domain-containing protein [Kangiellaceae bacterium]|jgi:hypothetical protein